MAVVRTLVASLSWAIDMAGPLIMTKLPFEVHLAAEIRTLAWQGVLTRASLQTVTNKAGVTRNQQGLHKLLTLGFSLRKLSKIPLQPTLTIKILSTVHMLHACIIHRGLYLQSNTTLYFCNDIWG